jgi:hypothetical protein
MGAVTQVYGARQTLVLTGLASLASSTTAGWRSDIIDNRTTAARDYEISFTLPMANTTPGNGLAVFPFLIPGMHDGSGWVFADGGTVTLPTIGPGAYSFAGITTSNNFAQLPALAYTVADQAVQGIRFASQAFGGSMPDGFLVFLLNYSAAAFDASGQIIAYRSISDFVA